MTNKLISVFVFVLFMTNINGQNAGLTTELDSSNTESSDSLNSAILQDSVNIRSLLDKEISDIKAKQKLEDAKLEVFVVSSEKIKTINDNLYLEYGFWVIEAILIAVIAVFWYKRVKYRKQLAVKTLKFNISKMRQEKIVTGSSSDLTEIRRNLITYPIQYNDHGRDIVQKARALSIAKGEVYLAVKLKLLAGEMK